MKKQSQKPIIKFPKFETLEDFITKKIYNLKTRGHSDETIIDAVWKIIKDTEEHNSKTEEEQKKEAETIYRRTTRKPTMEDAHLLVWSHLLSLDKREEYISEDEEESSIERMALIRERKHALKLLIDLAVENTNSNEKELSTSELVEILQRKKD